MTLNESKSILKKICKQHKIDLDKGIYALVNNSTQMWQFLTSFSNQGFPLGFDIFEGTCSGDAELKTYSEFVGLVANDCGTSEFLFIPKSLIVIIPDSDYVPTFIFESDNYSRYNKDFNDNIREYSHNYSYKYVEAVKLINSYKDNLIFDKEKVDEIIGDFCSGNEEADPYISKNYYLSRKIFASVNIQLFPENKENKRYPLLLPTSFPFLLQDKSIQELDEILKKMLEI